MQVLRGYPDSTSSFIFQPVQPRKDLLKEKGKVMEYFSTLIGKRLAECRIRRKYANTKEEADKFLAEEEGLLDAMLGRNRLDTYGHDHQARRESYEIGLLDGQMLMGLHQWSYGKRSFLVNLKHWWGAHNPLSR